MCDQLGSHIRVLLLLCYYVTSVTRPVSLSVLILNLNFEQKEIRELSTKQSITTGVCVIIKEVNRTCSYNRSFSLRSGIFRRFTASCANKCDFSINIIFNKQVFVVMNNTNLTFMLKNIYIYKKDLAQLFASYHYTKARRT